MVFLRVADDKEATIVRLEYEFDNKRSIYIYIYACTCIKYIFYIHNIYIHNIYLSIYI